MKSYCVRALLSLGMAALVLGSTTPSQACLFPGLWGAYRPTYAAYSASYAPSYYQASYAPSYYQASYYPMATYYPAAESYFAAAPVTSPCTSCCPGGNCGIQSSYYAPSSCCSPCDPCGDGCSNCAGGNCDLALDANDKNLQPRSDPAGAQQRNPTFIEEEDKGSGYETVPSKNKPQPDGFAPRNSSGETPEGASDEDPADFPDPLDGFGPTKSTGSDNLRFKIPESVIKQREPAPSHEEDSENASETRNAGSQQEVEYPLLKLNDKITSRTAPKRTRLIQHRSWKPAVIAEALDRNSSDLNAGWVPLPAPTRLVQK